jgi:hypothetical protein
LLLIPVYDNFYASLAHFSFLGISVSSITGSKESFDTALVNKFKNLKDGYIA